MDGCATIGDLQRELLIAASGPGPPDDTVPESVLAAAQELMPQAAGAGLVFHGPGSRLAEASIVRLRIPARADVARVGRLWCEDPEGPAASAVKRGEPIRAPGTAASAPPGAAEAVWVPMIEGRQRVHGVLGVASAASRPIAECTVEALGDLAAAATPALCRLLLRRRLAAAGRPHDVVGVSRRFLDLECEIRKAAAYSDGPVLVLGERGSGKELVASALHAWSPRRERPYVPVLASAFSEGLIVDELFGHERNAFTGAGSERQGRFGAADGGTLFLDEVGDLPMSVQSSLMRIIDKGELPRVGRDLPLAVDVRVVAATNRDVAGLLERREFRRDLYDRLRVFELRVPSLRQRPEDVPLLASCFLRRHCHDVRRESLRTRPNGCPAHACGPSAPCTGDGFLQHLAHHDWPGNVRQLENLIRSLVALSPEEVLRPSHLPRELRNGNGGDSGDDIPAAGGDLRLDTAIRRHVERVLALAGQNQSRAARMLGLPLSTFRNKMKRLGMTLPDGRRTPQNRERRPRLSH